MKIMMRCSYMLLNSLAMVCIDLEVDILKSQNRRVCLFDVLLIDKAPPIKLN
jgi:hypothetical protein